jgi:hypothetical protein
MKEIAVADNPHRAVDVVLIDGNIDPVVIEKYTAPSRESSDAIIENLKRINGTGGRFDGAEVSAAIGEGATKESESVDDRAP